MPSDRKFQKSRTSDFENFLLSISKIFNFLGIETEINLLAVFVQKFLLCEKRIHKIRCSLRFIKGCV